MPSVSEHESPFHRGRVGLITKKTMKRIETAALRNETSGSKERRLIVSFWRLGNCSSFHMFDI